MFYCFLCAVLWSCHSNESNTSLCNAAQRRPSAGSGASSDACAQITRQLLAEKTLREARKSITAFINHAIQVRNENEARTKKKMNYTRHEEKEQKEEEEQEQLKVVAAYEDEEKLLQSTTAAN